MFSFGYFCNPKGLPNQQKWVSNAGIFFFVFYKLFDTESKITCASKHNLSTVQYLQTLNALFTFYL